MPASDGRHRSAAPPAKTSLPGASHTHVRNITHVSQEHHTCILGASHMHVRNITHACQEHHTCILGASHMHVGSITHAS